MSYVRNDRVDGYVKRSYRPHRKHTPSPPPPQGSRLAQLDRKLGFPDCTHDAPKLVRVVMLDGKRVDRRRGGATHSYYGAAELKLPQAEARAMVAEGLVRPKRPWSGPRHHAHAQP